MVSPESRVGEEVHDGGEARVDARCAALDSDCGADSLDEARVESLGEKGRSGEKCPAPPSGCKGRATSRMNRRTRSHNGATRLTVE